MPSNENFKSALVAFVKNGLARGVLRHPLLDDVQQDIGIQKDAHSASV